ncbi:hypothetical protein B0J12DRAFT_121831 [Macrophomina phaseolina]|uniref:DUF1330 domain-containing protein n=1 Tax=Macrophomina phaseolina TaxID=35725 RepID=A0ABQ8G7Q7_9PEZI|nr:hypothetical protein B0J12DRAFT_121831 [Macrophomina phaseolina]
MPLCTLHLLSLTPTTSLSAFLADLSANLPTPRPLTIARVLRWIITPTSLSADPLRSHTWDLLLVLPTADAALPDALGTHIAARWSVTFGVPSRVLEGYAEKNARLLQPRAGDVPALSPALSGVWGTGPPTTKSAQGLELSGELLDWMREQQPQQRGARGAAGPPVSMLNLLAFRDGMKPEYLKYGRAFAESVGSSRGGVAKVVGTVVRDGKGWGVQGKDGDRGEKVWDEVALAHYPSIWHFADMLASDDYQAVNRKYRVGSLKDTFILCTTEVGLPGIDGKEKGSQGRSAAKL